MSTLEMVLAVATLVVSLILILLVMSQRSREESLGSAFGDLGTGFEGEHGSSRDMKLAKYTKWLAILGFLIVVGADIVTFVL